MIGEFFMNQKDLKYIENKLSRQLEDLLGNGDCNLQGLEQTESPLPDIIDQASNIADRNLSHVMCDRESFMISRIQQSLQDIAKGDYGICDHCEENITIKRLKANPVARYCIDCKTEIETTERLTGT